MTVKLLEGRISVTENAVYELRLFLDQIMENLGKNYCVQLSSRHNNR